MDCDQARQVLHAHLDGELDSASAQRVDDHLRGCTGCSEIAARHGSLSRALRQVIPLTAPAALRQRLGAMPRAVAHPTPSRARFRVVVLAVGALAAGIVVGWFLATWQFVPAPREMLVHDLVAAHVRSLLPGHLPDVKSSDHHTVKPWFSGRLDYSPWVADLTADGFPLVGGRVDYVGGRRVAILVYQRRQHIIDLMVAPLDLGSETITATTNEGFHLQSWTLQGQAFTAISDVNAAELTAFANAVRKSSVGTGH